MAAEGLRHRTEREAAGSGSSRRPVTSPPLFSAASGDKRPLRRRFRHRPRRGVRLHRARLLVAVGERAASASARRTTRSPSARVENQPTGCVWELAIVDFERRAWIEDVLLNPPGPDLERYLERRLDEDV